MNTTNYRPQPIKTDQVAIPEELKPLIEDLARSNHDIWAQQRLAQGWKYGAVRDDALKTHPDLIPYEQLTETEKNYDRNSVIETLKAVLALGYEIRKVK